MEYRMKLKKMETENEKPTIYLISGHSGAGKTTGIAELLPDHPFIPEIYDYNKKLRTHVDKCHRLNDFSTFNDGVKREGNACTAYIAQQMSKKENIYIEIDSSHWIGRFMFQRQTEQEYNMRFKYLLCDSLRQSVDSAKPGIQLTSRELQDITEQYHEANDFVNQCANTNYNVDIYSKGYGQSIQLLATIEKGKVIIAKPEIMTKIWLDPSGPLARAIGTHLIKQRQNLLKHRTNTPKENPKTKRGKGLGM